jgi:hypothetical protein
LKYTRPALAKEEIDNWPNILAHAKLAFLRTDRHYFNQQKETVSHTITINPPASSWAINNIYWLAQGQLVHNPKETRPTDLLIEWMEPKPVPENDFVNTSF